MSAIQLMTEKIKQRFADLSVSACADVVELE